MVIKRKVFVPLIVIAFIILISLYIVFLHNYSEKCFVREMREWGEKENKTDKIAGVTQEDEKKAVAKAKTLVQELKYEKLNDDSKDIYLEVKINLEYCNVK
jgi:flagellar basal body-associated protein FliL